MSLNLGHKLIGGTMLLLVAVSFLFTYPKLQEEQRQIEVRFAEQGKSDALSAASSCVEWMITEDYSYVETYLHTLAASKPDLVFARVIRTEDSQSVASWEPEDATKATRSHETFTSPIILEGMEDEPFGHVEMAISNEWMAALFDQRVNNLLTNVGLMVATLGALLWMLNRKLVSKPIEQLDGFADALGAGDLETSIQLTAKDELGNLAATMDAMRRRLKKSYEQVKEQNEKLLEVDEMKDEFIGTISHEMRTPMNGVIGMTDLLADTKLSDEQNDYVATIQSSSAHLLRLINDVLDISRLQAGRFELSTESFDVHAVLHESAERTADEAEDIENVRLLVDVADDVPTFLRGDAARLRQVLNHLGSNAAKFTTSGEVVFTAEIGERNDDGSCALTFAVRDTGVGIAPEHVEQIFKSFSQADNSDTRNHGGSGLGLSIASHIVELMGGQIAVDSEVGKGSTFSFTVALHAVTDGETEAAPMTAIPDDAKSVLATKRALVVMPHDLERSQTVASLASAGCSAVDTADSGAALELIAQAKRDNSSFDVAIVDSRIDASFLAHGLRDGPDEASTPALVLHPRGTAPTRTERAANDHSSFLGLPTRPAHLCEALVKLLDRASQPPEPQAAPVAEAPAPAEQVATPEPKAQATPEAAPTDDAEEQQSLTVLIVEDNAVNQKLAKRVVTKQGHTGLVAANGQEALDAYDVEVPDVILMDCQMPVMDGFDATRGIREREVESGIHTPIIALTAHSTAGDRQKCIDAGMDDYIPKPFKPSDIAGAFKRWTGNDDDADAE